MSDAVIFAAVGGAAGTLALLLAVLRLEPLRRKGLRWLAAWTKAPLAHVVPVILALGGGAVYCLSGTSAPEAVTTLAQHLEQGEQPKTFDLLAAAPGAPANEVDSPGTSDDVPADAYRDKAIESLRSFASRIEGKREMIASLGQEQSAPETTGGLPDVDTMMERLRERLKAKPDDVKGWMTLGWAYANTGKYAEAVTAYETALKLDSGNDEIKSALADVRGKATASAAPAEQKP